MQYTAKARPIEAKVDSFAGKDHVEAVRLTVGEELGAAVVLVSAGIQPEVELAREAGLKVGRGMVVDDRIFFSSG